MRVSTPDTLEAVNEEIIMKANHIVPPVILQFFQMEVMSTMHHHPGGLIHVSATKHMQTFNALTRIPSIWLLRASDRHDSQQYTACVHNMGIILVAPNLC